MDIDYTFPFGNKVHLVRQSDRTKKKVFVLGVYASAVHAKWISPNGNIIIKALAVASEPYIFWRGEDVEDIINHINMPSEIGRLERANPMLNGPSGRALDELYLEPLGLDRSDTWLCDLVPHTCLNKNQTRAIENKYNPITEKYGLPKVTIPVVPSILADDKRRGEILEEIYIAQPRLVILLGDQPIKWFLKSLNSNIPSKLSVMVSNEQYGEILDIPVYGKMFKFLLLVHPRQAAGLSIHSTKWKDLHRIWMNNQATIIYKEHISN